MRNLFWVGCFPSGSHSVGDHAQTLAVEQILKEQFSDYNIKRYSRKEVHQFFQQQVNENDLIFLHSSGDFGDLYNVWHKIRKKIIAQYSHIKTVQLPVNVYYCSHTVFEEDKIFFSDKTNLLILCRIEEDAELLRNNFGCKAKYFPDFVFSLKPHLINVERKGTLAVLRQDNESLLKRKAPKKIHRRWLKKLKDFMAAINFTKQIQIQYPNMLSHDTQISDIPITDSNRESIIFDVLDYFQHFKLVITDRFHACVFAILTKTSYMAVQSKIRGKSEFNPNVDPATFTNFRAMIESELQEAPITEKIEYKSILPLIKSRRSIRKWTSQQIEPHKLQEIAEAGVYAPSASNTQATKLTVITDRDTIKFICQNTSPWFRNSFPSAIVLVMFDKTRANTSQRWMSRFVWQDTACAMMNMMLQAESLGLHTCWASVNPEQEKRIKRAFGLNMILTCLLFVGYSNQNPSLLSKHQGRTLERGM